MVAKDLPVDGLTLWTLLVSGSALLAGLSGPFLGSLADIRRLRKRWLVAFAMLGSICTSALVIATSETLAATCILFFIASSCFTISLTFYHSFLNDLSEPSTIGRISGFGWAWGYMGGGICLALNLLMIQYPAWFHLSPGDIPIRLTFLTVGLWWAFFSLPIFFWIHDSRDSSPAIETNAWPSSLRLAWRKVVESLKAAGKFRKNLFLFLISYLLYNDAIETTIVVAGIFASQEIGMSAGETAGCFLMIQFVAFFGSLWFGWLADRWSNKKALQASLGIWALILIWAIFMRSRLEFWIASSLIALVLGGSQAVSRSLFGKMVPRGEEAQHYGFWSLSGKISASVGPLMFGLIHEFSGQMRYAMLFLLVLLIIGQCLLAYVREPECQVDKV